MTILYTDIESCMINNGVTTKYFKIKSGIQQGCPLSALLFVISVEILSIQLKTNNLIRGIKLGNKTFTITQLADDTTLFLNDINSLREALQMLSEFYNIAGLLLNGAKTEIMQIGIPLTLSETLFRLKSEKKKIFALGSWFYKDNSASIMHTYTDRSNKVILLLNKLRRRNLTWIGKITVPKTLCISCLNYAMTTVEIPERFIRQIKDLCETFLRSNKLARIKNRVKYNDNDNGGLRMVNIDLYSIAQKLIG